MPAALPSSAPAVSVAERMAASARALQKIGVPVWQAGELARITLPTAATGWPELDAELPGGGWPLAGLTELLLEQPASGELALLEPWLRALTRRALGSRELLWVAPPALPCVAALQAMGLPPARLVCVHPASAADAAWAIEQALRAASCATVLWWSTAPTATTTLRRLHLAAQAGATPLMALRPLSARSCSSPAPLRLACRPQPGRRLALEVFKRRGPPMAAPLLLNLPWPASARRPGLARPADAAPHPPAEPQTRRCVEPQIGPHEAPPYKRPSDVVDRPAPAAVATASPALVAARA